MLRFVRIAILLYLLAFVAVGTLVDSAESTNWDFPLHVVVYPVAGDPGNVVGAHIDQLDSARFEAAESFLAREAERFGVALERPVRFSIAPERNVTLPALADRPGHFGVLMWSLKMRWTAWRLSWSSALPAADITLFAVFHNADTNSVLDSSTALRKGLIAIANVYADTRHAGSNDVVMLHELLHTLGATDKYDLGTLQPHFPNGYAEPQSRPLHPQRFTEIMAGRRALSPTHAEMPGSLRSVRVGAMTAQEIGWQ